MNKKSNIFALLFIAIMMLIGCMPAQTSTPISQTGSDPQPTTPILPTPTLHTTATEVVTLPTSEPTSVPAEPTTIVPTAETVPTTQPAPGINALPLRPTCADDSSTIEAYNIALANWVSGEISDPTFSQLNGDQFTGRFADLGVFVKDGATDTFLVGLPFFSCAEGPSMRSYVVMDRAGSMWIAGISAGASHSYFTTHTAWTGTHWVILPMLSPKNYQVWHMEQQGIDWVRVDYPVADFDPENAIIEATASVYQLMTWHTFPTSDAPLCEAFSSELTNAESGWYTLYQYSLSTTGYRPLITDPVFAIETEDNLILDWQPYCIDNVSPAPVPQVTPIPPPTAQP